MKIEETDSFIIFRDVTKQELSFFNDFKYDIWFIEFLFSDGIFSMRYVGEDLDLSEYEPNAVSDDELEVSVTLYCFK